jgi:tripartite-type tricarboxylate transporter receptor subunit TctC
MFFSTQAEGDTVISFEKTLRQLALLAICAAPLVCAAFPTKPVTIVVPYGAGSSLDGVGRALSEVLSKEWGQPVIIENRPGANGVVATQQVIRAQPDGHTILYHLTGIIQNPLINKAAKYDPQVDVQPVIMIGNQGTGLAVPKQTPANSVSELIAYYKQNPDKASYASAGVGQTGHIFGELLAADNGFKAVHVPYNGPGPIAVDLMEGRVGWSFISAADAARFGKDGRLKILGVTGRERIKAIDEVKTLEEQGFSGFELVGWHGLFVPANTPKAVVDQLTASVQKAMEDKRVKDVMETYVVKPTSVGPAQFKEIMKSDTARWKKLVDRFNISTN